MIVINWYYFTLSCNAITKTSLLHVLKSVPAITKIIGNSYTDNSNFIPPLINIKKYLSENSVSVCRTQTLARKSLNHY